MPLGPGRAQIAPPVANAVNARAPPIRARISTAATKRISRILAPAAVAKTVDEAPSSDAHTEMDVEEDIAAAQRDADDEANALRAEAEIAAMMGVDESDEEDIDETAQLPPAKIQRVWPEVSTQRKKRFRREVEAVQERFEDHVNVHDMTMVSEYADEIFEYMNDLEVCPFSF